MFNTILLLLPVLITLLLSYCHIMDRLNRFANKPPNKFIEFITSMDGFVLCVVIIMGSLFGYLLLIIFNEIWN